MPFLPFAHSALSALSDPSSFLSTQLLFFLLSTRFIPFPFAAIFFRTLLLVTLFLLSSSSHPLSRTSSHPLILSLNCIFPLPLFSFPLYSSPFASLYLVLQIYKIWTFRLSLYSPFPPPPLPSIILNPRALLPYFLILPNPHAPTFLLLPSRPTSLPYFLPFPFFPIYLPFPLFPSLPSPPLLP